MPSWIINGENELDQIVKFLIKTMSVRPVVLLKGGLGAGKTTLVKYLLSLMNSQDAVSSPSFSIINEYETDDGLVYHMDLYRLKDLEEIVDIGLEEYIWSGNVCLIEWPELAESMMPENAIFVNIELNDEQQRIITIN